jgi:hypothetical protein
MKVGDIVSWKSQALGHAKEKIGKIVAVVPPFDHGLNCLLRDYIPNNINPAKTSIMFDGFQRKEKCYIVQVGTKLYCPRVSQLTPSPEEAR